MTPEQINQKLADAGCVMTSAGVIAVDTRKLVTRFLELVEENERLANEVQARGAAEAPKAEPS